MALFTVSVKGVLKVDGKYLLRKNEYGSYELLGGRLERSDKTLEERLKIEFAEESGVKAEVIRPLEPFFILGSFDKVLIVPFECKALQIPDVLHDEDGGIVEWIEEDNLKNLDINDGYLNAMTKARQDFFHKSPALPKKSKSDKFFTAVWGILKHPFFYIKLLRSIAVFKISVSDGKTTKAVKKYVPLKQFTDENFGKNYRYSGICEFNARKSKLTLGVEPKKKTQ